MTELRFLGMRAWAELKFKKAAEDVTIADVEKVLPRRDDLREAPFEDRLGGRVRFRLRPWPTEDRAAELARRAEHFRRTTPAE